MYLQRSGSLYSAFLSSSYLRIYYCRVNTTQAERDYFRADTAAGGILM